MSYDDRKPWEIPISYNEDRWQPEVTPESMAAASESFDYYGDADERDAGDIEELLRRPDRVADDKDYECTDMTPVDYSKGPHDTEFGVDENEFDEPDKIPIDYGSGPHDDEFGVDDDEMAFDEE